VWGVGLRPISRVRIPPEAWMFVLCVVTKGQWRQRHKYGSGTEYKRDFLHRPDAACGPPSLLYNGNRVAFPGTKRPGRGVNHRPLYSDEVKERVELYLYSPLGLQGLF
jgi:hypothetical protein